MATCERQDCPLCLQVATYERQLDQQQHTTIKQLQDQQGAFQREMLVASQLRLDLADRDRQINMLRQMHSDEATRATGMQAKFEDAHAQLQATELRYIRLQMALPGLCKGSHVKQGGPIHGACNHGCRKG